MTALDWYDSDAQSSSSLLCVFCEQASNTVVCVQQHAFILHLACMGSPSFSMSLFPRSTQALGTSAMNLRLLAETLEREGKTDRVSLEGSICWQQPLDAGGFHGLLNKPL